MTVEGAHAARADVSDQRRGRPEGFQPELLVRRLGAQGHAQYAIVNKLAASMAEVSKDKAFIDETTSLGIVPTGRC